jgi:MFS family permease
VRRPFWLSSGVIFLDEVLYVALFPLLPIYAMQLGLSKAETGLLVAAYPMLMLVSSLPAGILADRVGSRRLLLAGSVLLVLASLGFGYAEETWQLWAARGLQGLTSGLTSVAGMALIATIATPDRRATIIGLATSLMGLSALAGPALGGYAVPALGAPIAFLLPAAFGALLFLAILWPGWSETRHPARASIGRDLAALLRSSPVRGSVVCILACGLVGGAVQTLIPLRLGAAGYTTSELGSVFVVAALIGLAGTPLAGRLGDRCGVGRVTTGWCAVVSLLVLALAASSTPFLAVALVLMLYPLLRVGGSLGYALGAEHAPLGAGLAAGYGLALAAWSAGAVLGPLSAGVIADTAGDSIAFLAAAATGALLTLGLAMSQRPAHRELVID